MPVTLADAKLQTQDDLDGLIIDEFRKQGALLDTLIFHDAVSPMGGGSTLTYGYHRHITERSAAFRAINNEYTAEEAKQDRFTVDLKPLGGRFGIDRVLAQIARGAEASYQLQQLAKASRARFNDELINGDTDVDSNGFDGLDKALTGSDTEMDAQDRSDSAWDWTSLDGDNSHLALDLLDEFLSLLDGVPTVIVGNNRSIGKLRAIARRANQYVQRPVEGLTDGTGSPIVRSFWNDATLLVDAGEKAGSANRIVPVETRDLDSSGTTEPNEENLTDIYAYRVGMDGFHGVTVSGQPLVRTWMPDFSTAGAVKDGETEMGPLATALKATKSAAVLRNVKVS